MSGAGGQEDSKVAILTTLIAMSLAVSFFMSTWTGNDSLQMGMKAADQWVMFQGKTVRASLCESEINQLNVQLNNMAPNDVRVAEIKKRIVELQNQKVQYSEEREAISASAKESTEISNAANSVYYQMRYASGIFQLALVMVALIMLTKSRFLWYFDIVIEIFGVIVLFRALFIYFT